MFQKMKQHRRTLAILALALVAGGAAFSFVAFRPKREITTRSGEAYAAYVEGMDAFRKLYYGDARKSWLRAVEIDSTCAMAWMRLSMVASRREGPREARRYLARAEALAERMTPKEQLFIRLVGAEQRQDEPECDRVLEVMVQRYPEDTEILFMSGIQRFHRKDYPKAVESFERLLARAPEMGEVYNMMGYALVELGRFPEAVEAFQKYAFVYPDQANPHDSLGELYLRVGRYEDALHEFAKAIGFKPDFSWAHFHSALAFAETSRPEKALQSVRAAIAASAESPELTSWRRQEIFFEMAAGHLDQALHLASRVQAKDFDDPMPHFALGRVHAARGETNRAREELGRMRDALVKYAKENPGPAESKVLDKLQVYELEGEIAMAEGRIADALGPFCHAIGKADTWWVVRRVRLKQVECQIRSGRFEAALIGIREQLDVNPGDPAFHYWRGEALAGLGNYTEAEKEIRLALDLLPHAESGDPLLERATRRRAELSLTTSR